VRVRWLRKALENLDSEAEYIAKDNPSATEHVVTAIIEATERLRNYPGMGRAGRVLGTRELVISGTPYILPYRVRGDVIEILRVFHGARKWPDRY